MLESQLLVQEAIDLGHVRVATRVSVEIKNCDEKDHNILGAKLGCNCLAPDNLPLLVRAGSSALLHLDFNPDYEGPGEPQQLEFSMQLFTDTKRPLPATKILVTVDSPPDDVASKLQPIPQ